MPDKPLFKPKDPVIVPVYDDTGTKTGEVTGIFEGYGPMPEHCSVLVPHDSQPGNRRIWRVPIPKPDRFGNAWRHLTWAELVAAPAPEKKAPAGVPQPGQY